MLSTVRKPTSASTNTSSNGASMLRRRRGTSAAGQLSLFRRHPIFAVLLGLAVALSFGMVVMFLYLPDFEKEAAARSRLYQAKLAGVPNLLRGKIPTVQFPGRSGRTAEDVLNGDQNNKKDGNSAKKLAGADDLKNLDDDEKINHEKGVRERLRAEGLDVNAVRREKKGRLGDFRHGARPVVHANTPPKGTGVDLNLYDETPTNLYPYPLVAVPSNYTVKEYLPQGGMRYTEYTTGGTPYVITDDIKEISDEVARSRRRHVKRSMRHAWKGYVDHAFGADEVLPRSGGAGQNWGGQGITLVDALDTLWLMNMKDEFYKARDWVRDHLHHGNVGFVSVFETTIRDLGGLLSAFDWSRDKVFLDKALDLGERLIHSFDGSSTGLPFGQVNMMTGQAMNVGWTGDNAILSEFGSIQLENRYLSKMTKRSEFAEKTEKVFDILNEISPPNGLFPNFVRNNPRGGNEKPSFSNDKITFGAMSDSLYEYMLKVWLQGGKKETMYREMYDKAMDSMHKELLQKSTPSGLVYIADKNNGSLDHKMDHLVCFMGGLLALGAYTDPLGLESDRAQRDLRTAKALTYTCYQMYARMNTGISAEFVQFYPNKDLQVGRGAPHYLLRPEAVESFFILNYLTGDPVYREWGWEVWQSIEKYCKTDIAYGALGNVQDTSGPPRDSMESFFLAETLKYLYLLQDPDTEVDVLHKHVFNTEAHPFRIFPVIDQETS